MRNEYCSGRVNALELAWQCIEGKSRESAYTTEYLRGMRDAQQVVRDLWDDAATDVGSENS